MITTEIITAVLGSGALSGVVTYFTTRRSIIIKNRADADEVLLKRIDFLDKRITDLEKNVCFRTNCDKRI